MGSHQAIDGNEEAVGRMIRGQSVRVTLTPERAYGAVGFPPDSSGNAFLVYDLTLQEIRRNQPSLKLNRQAVMRSNVEDRPLDQKFKAFAEEEARNNWSSKGFTCKQITKRSSLSTTKC